MSLLAQNFREKVSKLKDHRMKAETEFGVGYSTGFLSFDFINGIVVHAKRESTEYKYYSVGIVDGSCNMIIGRSSSGKTTFTIQAASNIVRPYKTSCIFHDDIEGGINTSRLESLTGFRGEELRSKYVLRSTGITAENFYERVKMIHDLKNENRADYEYDTGLYDSCGNRIYKLEPTVYILDSLALLMPEKYATEDELSGQMSSTAQAKSNSMVFRRIVPMLKTANIILLVINHINQKVDINPMQKTKSQVSYLKQSESISGGNMPIYLSNNMIRVDDAGKLKPTEGFYIDGAIVELSLIKSRTNKVGSSCRLIFDKDNGFDNELSLFLLLKEHGRINGAGAFLYLADRNDMKFAQKNFKQKLRELPELRQVFMQEVMSVLSTIIPDSYQEPDPELTGDIEEPQDLSLNILSMMNSSAMEC